MGWHGRRSLLSFPLPKGKVSVAFHNVGFHDLGYALNAIHKRWRSLLNRKFLSGSGHRSKEIEILFQWFFQWLALQLCKAINLWWGCNSAEMSPEEIISFLPFPLVTFQNSKKKKKTTLDMFTLVSEVRGFQVLDETAWQGSVRRIQQFQPHSVSSQFGFCWGQQLQKWPTQL